MILPRTVPGSSAGFSPFMRTRNGLKPALRYLATAGLLLASGVIAARADEIPQQYHDTVKRGLDYLAKQQAKDGHWGAQGGQGDVSGVDDGAGRDRHADGRQYGARREILGQHPQGGRLADGQEPRGPGPRRADFLQNATEAGRYMYGHGFATLFLACAYGDEDDQRPPRRAGGHPHRAVKYIGNAQSQDGGWYYTAGNQARRIGDDHTAAGLACLPECRYSGAGRRHQESRRIPEKVDLGDGRRDVSTGTARRPPRPDRGRHCLLLQCRRIQE